MVEGALIAARAVQADLVVFGMKRSFAGEVERRAGGHRGDRRRGLERGRRPCQVFEGPDEYLYGEESALLETIDGAVPVPRVVAHASAAACGRRPRTRRSAPALVNNTESLANVPRILARGPTWFRTVGTQESPGTIVCTVTGYTRATAWARCRWARRCAT